MSLHTADSKTEPLLEYAERTPTSPVISRFGAAEFAAVIGAKQRGGRLSAELAAAVLREFDVWRLRDVRFVEVEPEDVRLAEHLVRRIELGLRAPDAVHLAICARLERPLLTFDLHQARAAQTIGLEALTPG